MQINLLFLFFLTLLTSCCQEKFLSVHTDYLSRENLASYHVKTPDPRLNYPPIGQRLIISWAMPSKYFNPGESVYMEVTIRFRNREEIIRYLPIDKIHGTFIYELLNSDYLEKKGIITYKVDLIANGYLLEEWRHQLWTELIILNTPEN